MELQHDLIELPLEGPGARLRRAREGMGLSVADVAAVTRIQQRHLAAIEVSDWASLPGRTYIVGFARSYARAVGLSEALITDEIRDELSKDAEDEPMAATSTFRPGDPARVPSARFAWIAAIGVLVVGGGVAAWHSLSEPATSLPSLLPEAPTTAPAPRAAPPPHSVAPLPAAAIPSGQVVFTALESGVWVKFADGAGKQLMQKQMALGESYALPADATAPRITTGRPQAFAITIGGRPVPKLGEVERTVKDVPVSAAALLARAAPAPVASASPIGGVPAARPSAAPTPAAHHAPYHRTPGHARPAPAPSADASSGAPAAVATPAPAAAAPAPKASTQTP